MLYRDKDGLIRYNYLKLVAITKKKTYKTLESDWL